MTSQTTKILCGSCRIPVEGPAKPEEQDMISCPSCGRSDNFKNVMTSITAFAEELMGNAFQKTLRQGAGRSKFIKITMKPIQQGNHAFITDLKL